MTSNTNSDWPKFPTETEIYILPNGEIVVADLPAELSAQLAQLTQPCPVEKPIHLDNVTDQLDPTQPD